jgi:hypothetical protein
MTDITKARINLKEGLIELEGSEEFVGKYLNEFKELLRAVDIVDLTTENDVLDNFSCEDISVKSANKKKSTAKKTSSAKKAAPKVTVERFDIHGNDKVPALETFMETKKPGTKNGNLIVVIGYYLTELLENDFFTLGQIEYAYKMLSLKRPGHLRQIMINEKNERDLFEPDAEDKNQWHLTRSGKIFVSDQLPVSES